MTGNKLIIRPNDVAFPANPETDHSGLTKREYFAAMAMQGLLATGNYDHFNDVTDAVRYADALIKALNFLDKEAEAK